MAPTRKPLIFFAFANDREGSLGYLRLAEEARGVRKALDAGQAAGLWEDHRDRIAVFHFGGHAGSYELLLRQADGKTRPIGGAGLAAFPWTAARTPARFPEWLLYRDAGPGPARGERLGRYHDVRRDQRR